MRKVEENMKALRYLGPERLEIQELKEPVVKEDEVLLKIKACGICGSDVHGFLGLTGRRIEPMTMGHEFAGEIEEIGINVKRYSRGEGVVVQPINFCGTCVNCRQGLTNMCLNKKFFGVLSVDGAMAEYLAVPEKLLYPLPKNCDYTIGALTEPYAVAYGSIKKAEGLEGKTVLILGAGTIGLCILQIVKLRNPEKVVVADISKSRLEMARNLGADNVVLSSTEDLEERIRVITSGEMIDVSFEAVGIQQTANQSIKCLGIGGKAIWVGMSQREMIINMQDIVCSARQIIGSFNYTHEEFGEVIGLIGSGAIKAEKLISKIVTLERAPQAFIDLHQKPDELIKVLIEPES